MYLRHTTITKRGKQHTYWRLVRSLRVGKRLCQETVAYLGELDSAGLAKASALAEHFLGPRAHQLDLFEDNTRVEPLKVCVDRVRVELSRAFGDVWLAWKLWQALPLDQFCEVALPTGREKGPWPEIAAILVLARLCNPSSELHIAEDWYRRTALEDILGVPSHLVHHTRLYQGFDRLLPCQRELEEHLKHCYGELFSVDYDLLLYVVTSTYFESEARINELAQRGYSRDKRGDQKQVRIGLVVTRQGFPLGYEVFAGNRTDVTTVEEIVATMEERYDKAGRVWVMDRGMASEDNLQWSRDGDRKYLIGAPRSELRRWSRGLEEARGWRHVHDGLEVKIVAGPDGDEVFLLCRSADRRQKEAAMHKRFGERIVTGLTSLARRLATASRPQPGRAPDRAAAGAEQPRRRGFQDHRHRGSGVALGLAHALAGTSAGSSEPA